MTIELIDDKQLWDDFVEASPYGLLFHRWEFLKLIEKHSGYKLLPYGVYLGNELICVFPLFLRKYPGLKMVFSPPPQTAVPYLGPVMTPAYDTIRQRSKEHYMSMVAGDIHEQIDRISPGYTHFVWVPGLLDVRPFKWNGYSAESLFTYTIDLTRPLDEIWKGFGKDCRERIRDFSRVSFTQEESDDLTTFYRLSEELYGQQGLSLPLLGQQYLEEVMRLFPDNLKMYFLRRDGEIVDIEGTYAYKNHFKLLWGISNEKYRGHQEYHTWDLIKKAKERGFKEFEIVGANTRRISHYQSKFNPSMSMYFSVQKMNAIGSVARWSYQNLIRRQPLKARAGE
ncbi:GNAT family N-acetyltransferase [Methanocella arvoryzae]|uniref:BioF2-like acetyltransferase domain-containing protein n=1 Tax=Methanocella arvoryzae (strain DSM 22066 / NBRC 105507 / MRE50) TaxID=351160 RepID=Q0W7C3_METAR|nr:GNAT family N-acetyltransferase [Methanocella arvoryzae]CAH04767.1 hypothetical protein orf2 [uncultured archaeon]CAJ35720.1 conserved hypothetical protein [Methanocella arvoryzae MRE50]